MTAITEPRGPVIVLLTLRADFYDRPMKYDELSALVAAHQQNVPPMKIEDLRTIIERPAALPDVRLTFEGNLVGDLLFEVQGEIGALPLLQFTLDQLFEQRSGHRLTLPAYHSIGGVRGALTKQAESVYAGLPSNDHRELARSLFLRLIDPGTSVQDTTRRRASLEELTLPDPHQTATLRAVADAFITARLLTTNTVAGITTVEVSHEALIREWTRLTTWLSEAREDLHIQKQVSEDAAKWLRSSRPVDRLYRGTQLAQAQAWAERNKPSIDEVTFLQVSTAERERQERAEYARQARELELQRRAARRQSYVIGMMGVTSVVLIAGLIGALILYGQLQIQRNDLQIANQNLRASLPVSVTNLNDDGHGSLRNAIRIASPNSVITFAKGLNGTITLTSGELEITKNVTINGPGASSLLISGRNTSRVFHIDKGAQVKIFNLSIKNGHVSNFINGGGILNEGLLVLIDCAISNSVAANALGGGIYNSFGPLTLINSTVSDNIGVMGGGIYNAYGTLTLTNSTISDNKADNTLLGNSASNTSVAETDSIVSETAILFSPLDSNRASSYKPPSRVKVPLSGIGFAGGGIFNVGTLTLTNTTVSHNEANDGSGITNEGTAIITQSTISSNIVNVKGAPGAGIYNFGVLTLTNSTSADNQGQGDGGGIATIGSPTDLTFCTIYGNTTTGHGGGIFVGFDFITNKLAQVSMRNSIVAGNYAHDGSDISGPLTSYGYNLIQNVSGAIIQTASNGNLGTSPDITGLSPDVGPLQANGGPTQTFALQSGSPAINQIPRQNCFVNGVFTDQRGIQRPDSANSTNCDIGAYQTTS